MGGVTHNPSKSSFLRRLARCAAALCLITLLAFTNTSCTNIEKLVDPELNDAIMAKLQMFGTDFSTTSSIPIELNVGRKAIVHIYANDPFLTDDPCELLAFFTDENGRYKGKMTIPNTLIGTTLHAVATNYHSTAVASASATVFNGQWESGVTGVSRSAGASTLSNDLWCAAQRDYFRDYLTEGVKNTSKINTDRTNNDFLTTRECEVSVGFLYSGAANYWRLYYYYYKKGTTIDADYINNFINAGTRYNVFYDDEYFGIPSNLNQTDYPNDVYVINPDKPDDKNTAVNTMKGQKGIIHFLSRNKVDGSGLFHVYDLKFYGENPFDTSNEYYQNGTDKFPKDYYIGFVLKLIKTYNALEDSNFPKVYTNNTFNTTSSATNKTQVTRFSSSSTSSNAVILGFEDIATNVSWDDGWIVKRSNQSSEEYKNYKDEDAEFKSDWDYNDLILAIAAEPDGIEIDDPVIETTTGGTIFGTLFFEDLYPEQGDYDMNDVMLKYKVTSTLRDISDVTYITQLSCEFYPYCDGASYTNDFHFGLQLPNGGRYINTEVYTANKNALGNIYKVDVFLDEKELKESDYTGSEKSIFDPFIKVQETGYEVHLTGKTASPDATIWGDMDDQGQPTTASINYYYSLQPGTTDQYTYPFALDIPLNNRYTGTVQFVPMGESVRIDSECPAYLEWVNWACDPNHSTTNSSEDWYNWHTEDVNHLYIRYPYSQARVWTAE